MSTTIRDEFDCARFTKATQIRDDGSVDGDAFALREGEVYLSLNCLDLFETSERGAQIDFLRDVLRQKMTVRSSHRLSIINVGDTKSAARANDYLIDFCHVPEPDDETHCGLYGPEYNDEVIQDMIAECVTEVVKAL